MGRYLGPKERLSRRAGVDLGLKGERALKGKGALEQRGRLAPGQHGRRPRRLSTYGEQLLEKQKARWCYGIREKQFRRYAHEAIRKRSDETVAGERLLAILETRLDNVVYRLGFASTRAQARQFVSHGHVRVNGRQLDIASARITPRDTVSVRGGASISALATAAFSDVHQLPNWVAANGDSLEGTVLRLPTLDDIDTPVNEQLIIEYYARS